MIDDCGVEFGRQGRRVLRCSRCRKGPIEVGRSESEVQQLVREHRQPSESTRPESVWTPDAAALLFLFG